MVALVGHINLYLTELLPCPQPVPAPPGSNGTRRRRVVEGCFIFFERGLIVLESCDIMFLSPSVGFSSSFSWARGRGPTPYNEEGGGK